MTLKELSHLYFKGYRLQVKRSSYKNVKYTYFRSFIGYGNMLDKSVKDILELDLIQFQEHLIKRYQNNTATRMYYVIIRIFEFAKKIKLVEENIAQNVKFLKLDRSSTVKTVLSDVQFYAMLKNVENIEQRIYLELLFHTGLRSSEARGLMWEYINFQEQTIRVEYSIKCTKYGIYKLNPPKTRRSRRIIKVDLVTLNLLELLDKNGDFVFNKNGLPRTAGYCNEVMKTACKKADTSIVTPHNLRHSHATNLLRKGVPISLISRRLGHSKTSITEDTYLHLVPGDESRIVELAQERKFTALTI